MNNTSVRPAVLLIALALGLATLAGCSETPQEKYDNAVEKLQEARDSRNDARDNLNDKKEELKELRANLNESEAKLKAAGKKVEAASLAVNDTVTDEVLFRTIQRDVLDDDAFDKAAISVGVSDRVVTLTGNVPDDDTRKRALKLAREQAGVKNVVDELEVGEDQTEAPSAANNQSQPQDDSKQNSQQPSKPADDQSGSAQPGEQGNAENDAPKPENQAGGTNDKAPQSAPMGDG